MQHPKKLLCHLQPPDGASGTKTTFKSCNQLRNAILLPEPLNWKVWLFDNLIKSEEEISFKEIGSEISCANRGRQSFELRISNVGMEARIRAACTQRVDEIMKAKNSFVFYFVLTEVWNEWGPYECNGSEENNQLTLSCLKLKILLPKRAGLPNLSKNAFAPFSPVGV